MDYRQSAYLLPTFNASLMSLLFVSGTMHYIPRLLALIIASGFSSYYLPHNIFLQIIFLY